MKYSVLALAALLFLNALPAAAQDKNVKYPDPPVASPNTKYPMTMSQSEWKARLTPAQYYILREAGTERAFTGQYDHFYKKGTYYSAATLQPVFSSDAKFDSHTGWPSFFAPIDEAHVRAIKDVSYGMVRIETRCARCDSHQGHVFPDGPPPTRLRYCINSVSLSFVANGQSLPDPLGRGDHI